MDRQPPTPRSSRTAALSESGMDRLVTALALLATLGIILLAPLG
jgi:hypothetical protein